jgi:hypothetical protein
VVPIKVIGIIDAKISSLYGLYTNEATLAGPSRSFPAPFGTSRSRRAWTPSG